MNSAKQKKLDALRAQIADITTRSAHEVADALDVEAVCVTSEEHFWGDADVEPAKAALTPQALRQRALALLARREYAQAELHQRLQAYTNDQEMIAQLLQDFISRGWLDDARFAQQYTHSKGKKLGALRLQQELRQKGVADALIRQALSQMQLEGDSELVRARMVWQKKFNTQPQDAKARAQQIRFLQSRGFGFEVIFKVLGAKEDAPDE